MEGISNFTVVDPYQRYLSNIGNLIKHRGLELHDFNANISLKNNSHVKLEGKGFDVFLILKGGEELKKGNFYNMIKGSNRAIVIGEKATSFSHLTEEEKERIELLELSSVSRNFSEYFKRNGIKIKKKADMSDLENFHASSIDSYPHIHITSMECVWVGAKVGDVLQMERPNPGSTCTTGEYRKVVDTEVV